MSPFNILQLNISALRSMPIPLAPRPFSLK